LKRCCYSWGLPFIPHGMPPFLKISFHPRSTLTLLLPIKEVPLFPKTSSHSCRHLKSPHWGRRWEWDVAIPLDFSTFFRATLNVMHPQAPWWTQLRGQKWRQQKEKKLGRAPWLVTLWG
jgi:hypothetical protein